MKKETKYKIANSFLAGALVFLGGCSSGEMTLQTIYFSLIAGAIVAISQFRDYLTSKEKNYKVALFNFI